MLRYSPDNDHYHTLQVDPLAEQSVVHHAYKALVKQYHPDKFHGTNVAKANEMMQKINDAYHILGDVHKRKYYDNLRKKHQANKAAGLGDSAKKPLYQRIPVWGWIVMTILLMPLLSRLILVTPLGKGLMVIGSLYIFMRIMPKRG